MPTTGYTFRTLISNKSSDISDIISVDFNQSGIIMIYNQDNIVNIQKDSFINIFTEYYSTSPVVFSVYYTSSINFLDLTTNSTESIYNFNSGIILEQYSLNSRNVFQISQLNGVTYTQNQLLNGIIDRTNTPVTDSLPSNAVLMSGENLRNNDVFTFTVRNKGIGILTILLNDIGIDYNNSLGIFITVNSLEASTCCLVFNSFTQTFFAYELYRGAIVL